MTKLAKIKQDWIKIFNTPLIISGPCSAENEKQVLKTALELKKNNVQVFRAGIWKPRTKPGGFEGIGDEGLKWMQKVKKEIGMMTATEVAKKQHVESALNYDIDILWIGARSTVNPFTVQEIADALVNTNKIILVKNPINPDIDLWIGALERLINNGIKKLGLIHRGFSTDKKSKLRNYPNWKIVIDFRKKYPNIPIICDPSHICGNRDNILEISKKALNLKYDGLIVETHCDPDNALTDAQQQITPKTFLKILNEIDYKNIKCNNIYKSRLNNMRAQIDEIDENLISILFERMELSKKVGKLKKTHNINIFESKRLEKILKISKNLGSSLGLKEKFIEKIFKIIHEESVEIQTKL